jgi:hypothetical protein
VVDQLCDPLVELTGVGAQLLREPIAQDHVPVDQRGEGDMEAVAVEVCTQVALGDVTPQPPSHAVGVRDHVHRAVAVEDEECGEHGGLAVVEHGAEEPLVTGRRRQAAARLEVAEALAHVGAERGAQQVAP